MLKYIFCIFLLCFSYSEIIGQEANNLEYVNQDYRVFRTNTEIDFLEKKLALNLNNIAACLIVLELPKGFFNIAEEQNIYSRLQELSEKLFLNGTPIYLVSNGKNSHDNADKLNLMKLKNDALYVSLGNDCISSERFEKAVNVFNNRTLELIKLEKKH